MPKLMISDLQPNQQVCTAFVAVAKSLSPFRNREGSYLNVTLADKSGRIQARAWDNAENMAESFQAGDVVAVEGRVEEYRGKLQLIIEDISPCPPGEYDRADFLPTTKRDIDKLMEALHGFIEQVQEPHLNRLLHLFFDDPQVIAFFREAPGAKALHHSHVGGLLEHTVAVVTILCTLHDLHPELNRDLLIVGGLLHDIGKMQELECETSIEYTDTGRLVGHIVLTDRMVRDKIAQIADFPRTLDDALNHILLSHHGQKEYGAPIVPMTAEACALHYADNLDAHVQYFAQVIEEGQGSGNRWSEYQKLFERFLYIGDSAETLQDEIQSQCNTPAQKQSGDDSSPPAGADGSVSREQTPSGKRSSQSGESSTLF